MHMDACQKWVRLEKSAMLSMALFLFTITPAFAGTSGFQEYLIPGQESLLRTNYAYIDNDPAVGNTMHCVVSVTASTDGTIINYDHWENGYGTPDETYTLDTGEYKIFESGNIPANPRGTATYYDGGDRITVIGGPAFVSRASWPESPGTVMASAFEILPVQALSNSFEMPVGSDLYQSNRNLPFSDFQRVALMIQSTQDNNLITVYNPDNSVLWTGTLNKGASVTDASLRSVRKGTRVTATYPIQIQFLNGLQVSNTGSQINGFTGVPTALWGRRYAVAATSFPASTGSLNSRTDLYLYNPNSTSITVSYHDSTSGTFTIAAKELASFFLKTGHYVPRNYGVDLTGSDTFWGFGIAGSGYDTWDWGFILMPKEYCRSSYVVGWAPGDLNASNNYSAVYVMPFSAQSQIYVDYDQDGSVDDTYTASWPQVVRITDADDEDMTGARIWSPDTLAMNYGEISGTPTAIGSPALDLGYTILPLAEQFVDEVLSIEKGVNIDSVVVGHPAEFSLTVSTHAYPVSHITVTDHMPRGWDYVAGSTTITFSNGGVPDHTEPVISGSVEDGLTLEWDLVNSMDPNETVTITFSIVPTSTSAIGVTENCAEVQGTNSGNTFRPDGCGFIDNVPGASIGDRVWNDLDRNGIQDAGEPGLADVSVALYTSGGTLISSTLSNSDGNYLFTNVIPGDYYLRFTAPAGYGFSAVVQGGDDSKDSDADPATGRSSITTLSAGEGDLGWDAGLYEMVASIQLQKLTNGEDADLPTGPSIPVGEAVIWTYIITNPGDVALSTIAVTDNQNGVTPVYVSGDDGNGLLDPQESWTYQATGSSVAGQYQNIGTVTGQYGGQTVTSSDPSHYFGPLPAIHIEKLVNGEDADVPAGPAIPVGQTVHWSYIVTNPGNVPLGTITVSDDKGLTPQAVDLAPADGHNDGDTNLDDLLDLDETWTYTAAGVVTAGQYVNTGTVTGRYEGQTVSSTDPCHYFGGFASIDLQKSTNGEDADNAPGPTLVPGAAVTWRYIVTNTGNVALDSIRVTDSDDAVTPVLLSGDVDDDGLLDLAEVWIFEAYGQATLGQYENTGTVAGHFEGTTVQDDDRSHYFCELPRGSISDLVWTDLNRNGLQEVGEPGLADVSITLYTGSGILVGSTLSNSDGRYSFANLIPGAYYLIFTPPAEYGVTHADQGSDDDLDSDADPATGRTVTLNLGAGENQLIWDVGFYPFVAALFLEKKANGEDADLPTGPSVPVGSPITWRYEVINSGDVALANVRVTDSDEAVTPLYVSGDDGDGLLEPDETWIYEASGTAINGQYQNLGTASGVYEGQTVTDSDPAHYFGGQAAIGIKKATNGEDADDQPGPYITPGTAVTWSYLITNQGNIAIGDILVTDSESGVVPVYLSGDDGNALLDPGESWSYQATGVAQTGQYGNVGTVYGTDIYGQPVTASDASHYYGPNPAIHLEKLTNGLDGDLPIGPAIPVGQSVVWSYLVTNTGNVELSTIRVTDNQEAVVQMVDTTPADGFNDGDLDLDQLLDPDETWIFIATGIASAGQYSNLGTVTGTFNGQTVHDSDPSHYFGGQGAIEIEKSTNGLDADSEPGPGILAGAEVAWRYQVRNIGNTPVREVAVSDNQGVTPVMVDAVPADGYNDGDANLNGLLDPGETWVYAATGTAQIEQYANIGSVTGIDALTGQTLSDEDPSHYFGALPGIDIEKFTNGEDADDEPGPVIILGGTVTWRYQVRNTGNVPLDSVVVADSDPAVHPMLIFGDLDSDQILDLDETWIFEAAGAAVAGQYANTGSVSGRYNGSIFQDSDASHYYAEGRMDFGDAPDPSYPTLLTSDGARHILSALYLGSQIDSEEDGVASANETGDDLDGSDDEDGIHFPSLPFIQNSENEVVVTSSGIGYLSAWIDFNRDGDWMDAGEKIISGRSIAAGAQSIRFQVPDIDPFAAPENRAMNARFRLSSQAEIGFAGMAPDGEVEDYQVAVYVPVELSSFTAAAAQGAVELSWTTQSETENLGFYLYRSSEESGPYECITGLINGAGSSTVAHSYRHSDLTVAPGQSYWYKLADVSFGGVIHLNQAVQVTVLPAVYGLEQNYPNPFNPETSIRFTLREAGQVSLTVVNMQGQIVKTLAANRMEAGVHVVKWDARNDAGIPMPSGSYLCILKVNGFSKTMRMTLLK
jgi:hypothetical protein